MKVLYLTKSFTIDYLSPRTNTGTVLTDQQAQFKQMQLLPYFKYKRYIKIYIFFIIHIADILEKGRATWQQRGLSIFSKEVNEANHITCGFAHICLRSIEITIGTSKIQDMG